MRFRFPRFSFVTIMYSQVFFITILSGLFVIFLLIGAHNLLVDFNKAHLNDYVAQPLEVAKAFYLLEQNGTLSPENAKSMAKEAIRKMRFGRDSKEYFWINSDNLDAIKMIMHPYSPELEGRDITSLTDKNGKFFVQEFVKKCSKNGSGYVEYLWKWKDDANRIEPKLSYVTRFEPWGWIIGTGLYVEEIKDLTWQDVKGFVVKALSVGTLIGIVFFWHYTRLNKNLCIKLHGTGEPPERYLYWRG